MDVKVWTTTPGGTESVDPVTVTVAVTGGEDDWLDVWLLEGVDVVDDEEGVEDLEYQLVLQDLDKEDDAAYGAEVGSEPVLELLGTAEELPDGTEEVEPVTDAEVVADAEAVEPVLVALVAPDEPVLDALPLLEPPPVYWAQTWLMACITPDSSFAWSSIS